MAEIDESDQPIPERDPGYGLIPEAPPAGGGPPPGWQGDSEYGAPAPLAPTTYGDVLAPETLRGAQRGGLASEQAGYAGDMPTDIAAEPVPLAPPGPPAAPPPVDSNGNVIAPYVGQPPDPSAVPPRELTTAERLGPTDQAGFKQGGVLERYFDPSGAAAYDKVAGENAAFQKDVGEKVAPIVGAWTTTQDLLDKIGLPSMHTFERLTEGAAGSWRTALGLIAATPLGTGSNNLGLIGAAADQQLAARGIADPSPYQKASAIGEIADQVLSATSGPARTVAEMANPWYFLAGGPVTKSAEGIGTALRAAGVNPGVASVVESTIANWGIPYADKALNAAFVNGLTKAVAARLGTAFHDVTGDLISHFESVDRLIGLEGEGGQARVDLGLTGDGKPRTSAPKPETPDQAIEQRANVAVAAASRDARRTAEVAAAKARLEEPVPEAPAAVSHETPPENPFVIKQEDSIKEAVASFVRTHERGGDEGVMSELRNVLRSPGGDKVTPETLVKTHGGLINDELRTLKVPVSVDTRYQAAKGILDEARRVNGITAAKGYTLPAGGGADSFVMPESTRSIAPTYSKSKVNFVDDRDRAVYTVTNKDGSVTQADPALLKALRDSGMSDRQIKARGLKIRSDLKEKYNETPGRPLTVGDRPKLAGASGGENPPKPPTAEAGAGDEAPRDPRFGSPEDGPSEITTVAFKDKDGQWHARDVDVSEDGRVEPSMKVTEFTNEADAQAYAREQNLQRDAVDMVSEGIAGLERVLGGDMAPGLESTAMRIARERRAGIPTDPIGKEKAQAKRLSSEQAAIDEERRAAAKHDAQNTLDIADRARVREERAHLDRLEQESKRVFGGKSDIVKGLTDDEVRIIADRFAEARAAARPNGPSLRDAAVGLMHEVVDHPGSVIPGMYSAIGRAVLTGFDTSVFAQRLIIIGIKETLTGGAEGRLFFPRVARAIVQGYASPKVVEQLASKEFERALRNGGAVLKHNAEGEFSGENVSQRVLDVMEAIPAVGEVMRRSNVAFNEPLNYVRALRFNNLVEGARRKGIEYPQELKDKIAWGLNHETGYAYNPADLPTEGIKGKFAQTLHNLGAILFSRQWQASRVAVYSDLAKGMLHFGKWDAADKEAMTSGLITLATNVSLIAGAAHTLGLDGRFMDWKDSKFGLVPLGHAQGPGMFALTAALENIGVNVQTDSKTNEKYADFTRGLGQDFRLFSQLLPFGGPNGLISGVTKSNGVESDPYNPKFGGRNVSDILVDWTTGHAEPVGRVLAAAINPFGRDNADTRIKDALLSSSVVMWLGSAFQAAGGWQGLGAEKIADGAMSRLPWLHPTPTAAPRGAPMASGRPGSAAPARPGVPAGGGFGAFR